MDLANIKSGQAFIKHEPTDEGYSSIQNPVVRAQINYKLATELNGIIASPITGVQKIRKVLHQFSLDIPAVYDLDHEGDEAVIEMDQFGVVTDYIEMPQFNKEPVEKFFLYLLYYLNDTGSYDFYVELTDYAGIQAILAETDISEHEGLASNVSDKK